MTEEDIKKGLESLVKELDKRTRFNEIDNLITLPSSDEKIAAMYDALDEFNSRPPVTRYTMETVLGRVDPRLRKLVVLGGSKNTVDTLIFDWTANGVDATIDEFNLPSRLGDYKDLLNILSEEFEKYSERLKITETRRISGSNYGTTGGGSKSTYYINSSRVLKSLKSGTGRIL